MPLLFLGAVGMAINKVSSLMERLLQVGGKDLMQVNSHWSVNGHLGVPSVFGYMKLRTRV